MIRTSSLLSVVAGVVVAVFAAEAASPVNKCIVNGAVTYQQGPCPSGQVLKRPTIQELNAEEKRKRAALAEATPAKTATVASPAAASPAAPGSGFNCDGRQLCSQMTSCAEARYFLANCPGVKIDGDRNGVPCEKQWCNR